MQTFIRFVINVASLILKGFVLQKLWIWFILGTFTTIQLSLPVAIGICLIFTMLKFSTDSVVSTLQDMKKETDKDKNTREWTSTLAALLNPLFIWFWAWIITLFM